MNTNRARYLMAAQKVRLATDPKPLDGKLTAEQRREIYAPRHAARAPQHLQGPQWVNTWKTTTRATYGLTAWLLVLFGGVIAAESKKGIKK